MKYVFSIAILMISILWGSFVGHFLWNWFVVPTFHLPVLSTLQLTGVSLGLWGVMPRSMSPMRESWSDSEKIDSLVDHLFLTPGVILIIGFFVHLFV